MTPAATRRRRRPARPRTASILVLHKPYGFVSRFQDESGHPGLAGLVDVRGVYAAGRLDHDSEGLLLLTDDGRLAHALTDPRCAHPRTYWAQVEGVPDARAIAALAAGVVVQGRRTREAEVRLLEGEPELPPRTPPIRFRKRVPTSWLELVLREGRNRQVRRMTAAVGHPTLRLVRAAIGPLELGALGLAPGAWRALDAREARALRDSVARAQRDSVTRAQRGSTARARDPGARTGELGARTRDVTSRRRSPPA